MVQTSTEDVKWNALCVYILNFRVNYTNTFLRKLHAKKTFPFLSKRYVPFSDTNTSEKKLFLKIAL